MVRQEESFSKEKMSDLLLELTPTEREALLPESRLKLDSLLQQAIRGRQLESDLAKLNVAAGTVEYKFHCEFCV